jgi:hypothetical protein
MATNLRSNRKPTKPAVEDEEMGEAMAEYQPEPDPQVEAAPQPEQAPQASSIPAQRVYADEIVIEHDLYKLKLASMKKNVAYMPNTFEILSVQHEHFFHTVDSSGTKQKHSNLVGSHFHQMTVVPQGNGAPPIVKCGPAVKEVKKLVNGRVVKVVEPCLRYPDERGDMQVDNHTHEIEYIKSNKIPVRKVNAEAVKVISAEAAKGAPIPGVTG